MALTYDQIESITRKFYIPKLRDNIFDSIALFNRLNARGQAEAYDGGTKVLEPLLYATTSSGGFYSGSDTLNTTDNEQFTAAEYDMKQAYVNITIERADELKNYSDARVLNLVKTKVRASEMTMKNNLAENVVSDGSDSDGMEGLEKGLESTANTVGGIDKSSYSWWQPKLDSSTTVLTISAMQSRFGAASVGNDKVTDIFTSQTVYDLYYALLQPQERFANSKVADAGFTNILFNGVPVIVDDQIGSDSMWFLNLNYIHFRSHSAENMRLTKFQEPVDQNVKTAKIYWAGCLTYSNISRQGALSAITS